jgi:dTDP-4-amino-4,6-dideoxygalactose transaminase
VGTFSTISGKITSTGEGGFVTTNDDELFEKMWGFQDFARRRAYGTASKFHWGLPCTNYRITNLQAAIGLQQMKRIDSLIAKRDENARYLNTRLRNVPGIRIMENPEWGERVYYYYAIRIEPETLGTDMLNFAVALAAEGIYDLGYLSTTRWIIPQHLQPLFVNKSGYGGTKCPFECPWYEGHVEYGPGLCPEAERACEEVFWVSSVNPHLEPQDLDDIATALEKVAAGFVEKKNAGIPIRYATNDQRDRIEFMDRARRG